MRDPAERTTSLSSNGKTHGRLQRQRAVRQKLKDCQLCDDTAATADGKPLGDANNNDRLRPTIRDAGKDKCRNYLIGDRNQQTFRDRARQRFRETCLESQQRSRRDRYERNGLLALVRQRFLPSQTACATMATATILRPRVMPIPIGPLKWPPRRKSAE